VAKKQSSDAEAANLEGAEWEVVPSDAEAYDPNDEESDRPLMLGSAPTRDALLDPEPDDIIPDNEEKGYHVGLVRQPVEAISDGRGGVRGYRSRGGESKFKRGSLAHLKAVHNQREAALKPATGPRPERGVFGVMHTAPVTATEAEARGIRGAGVETA
jgi:hypothetical protein